MKLSDFLVGMLLIISGLIMYYDGQKNYKTPRKRVALGLIIGGALLAIGNWLMHLIMTNN
jgi:lipoprotein signal peptidase